MYTKLFFFSQDILVCLFKAINYLTPGWKFEAHQSWVVLIFCTQVQIMNTEVNYKGGATCIKLALGQIQFNFFAEQGCLM